MWTLSCTLHTLLYQSARGAYFSAVPECYIRTVSGAYNAASLFFKPSSMFSCLPGELCNSQIILHYYFCTEYNFVLQQMANLLCSHCNNPRILNPGMINVCYSF